MDFDNYTSEDFALLHEFRKWVLTPTRDGNIFWSAWLKSHPEKRELIEQARRLVLHMPMVKHSLSKAEFSELMEGIESGISHSTENYNSDIPEDKEVIIPLNSYSVTGTNEGEKARISTLWKWTSYAAALILFATTVIFLNQYFGTPTNSTGQMVAVDSPRGQISLINLPDGSKVWLNSGSSIRYPKPFSDTERHIYLEGEAYFEVSKDSMRPFTVYSGDVATTALGTSFNINHFKENPHIDISLITGKVKVYYLYESVNDNSEGIILSPREKVRFSIPDQKLIKGAFDPTMVLNWKNGIIRFNEASYTEVKHTLERVYDIEFVEENETSQKWSYNGDFSNDGIDMVLKKLSLTEDFTYHQDENRVYIRFNR